MRNLVGPAGRIGCIVPTGIATDDTTKHFFHSIVHTLSLVSLLGFENEEFVFPQVDHSTKFCLLTLSGYAYARPSDYVFFARRAEQLDDSERRFTLTAEEIALLNPNTRTCPVFRSRRDAELTKAIYRRVPVLVREGNPDGNPWGVTFKQGLFNMTSDSHLFRTREQLEADGFELNGNTFERGQELWLPLYEAKMLHHYDHRWATYDNGDTRELTDPERYDPRFVVKPRYWVTAADVATAAPEWQSGWLLAFRNVARSTHERTFIATTIPRAGVGHSAPVALLANAQDSALLMAAWTSFACDYIARQKVGGLNMTFGFVYQFAVPRPDVFDPVFVVPRVLELTFTATDLAPFARDLGYDGDPFRWNPERRALIRAELDAAMFGLYGIERDDVEYIMATFAVVKHREVTRFGEYRTKRLILERYEAMAAAGAAGQKYETPLDPPPGNPAAAYPSPAPAATI